MLHPAVPENLCDSLQRLAGYLNFSSGSADGATLKAWNDVYADAIGDDPLSGVPAWLIVKSWIVETLDRLSGEKSAFADRGQADRVVRLLWSELLPAYLDFHSDLLFHHEPENLFNGFFLARASECLLARLGENDDQAIVAATVADLNDFVGYRPVATLETHRGEPYAHEFVRPIPLFIAEAGVSAGPYREIVTRSLDALRHTDPSILADAGMDLAKLDELAVDPRAYDFDHPVNRRPNYHFGGWDERGVGGDGCYHRFVIRQVTLEALLSRVRDPDAGDPEELMVEAASVLAGTILMASGITGWGPGAHSGDTSLASLMRPIAGFRDAFYEDRLRRLTGAHATRLADEQNTHRQPFGAARQALNAALARRRAMQVQHAQLARLYARMGYPDAAKRQVDVVAVPSARMLSRIDCDITLGLRALRAGRLADAVPVTRLAFERLRRSIECGALVDPWDLLGFAGNFPLYPGPENSVHDNRVDDILYVIDQLFAYTARVWSEAAAQDDEDAYQELELQYRDMAEWWRKYAAHTIESIEATDPLESYDSAKLVSRALRLWHRGGAAAGDVKFWAPHADLFDSPRAYALVITALLDRDDFVPAMALLVHWLSRADQVGLTQSGSSLPRLSERWLLRLRGEHSQGSFDRPATSAVRETSTGSSDTGQDANAKWELARKLFDYFEANAEEYWSAPVFHLGDSNKGGQQKRDWEAELSAADEELAAGDGDDHGLDEDSEDEDLFAAAYDDVVYEDTTDDGVEGSVFEYGGDEGSRDELQAESKRLAEHLGFLQTLARMWALAADMTVVMHRDMPDACDDAATRERLDYLNAWADRASQNRIGLLELLDSVKNYKIKPAGTDKESLRSYDRQRLLRDSLVERIIGTAVEISDARRLICGAIDSVIGKSARAVDAQLAEDDTQAIALYAALIGGDVSRARLLFPEFLDVVRTKSLLYIPLSRGGDPVKIYIARLRQRVLRHLVHWLPRRGMIAESCRLIEIARVMEQQNPIGVGAVTEFDGLFADGFRSIVRSIVRTVQHSVTPVTPATDDATRKSPGDSDTNVPDAKTSEITKRKAERERRRKENQQIRKLDESISQQLIPSLERLTEIMLASWLSHSQTLRLSPLEGFTEGGKWPKLVDFIQKYGDPLFTQTFLQLGNVRAVLHQGVQSWLERALNDGDDSLDGTQLFDDLERGTLSVQEASRYITLVYEAVFDHHGEYMDYNSTTTQSDRGELIHTFLDFLRLRVRYERIAWNLKPVMWAHEVLVHAGLEDSARTWRRSLSERIGAEAEVYVKRLRDLQREYAMRMPTVADRILERFARPMTIDRMRALVAPALADAEISGDSRAFELLEQETELLTRNPAGVGLNTPAWLTALEDEVEKLAKRSASTEIDAQALVTLPGQPLTTAELQDQLTLAATQGRRLPHKRD